MIKKKRTNNEKVFTLCLAALIILSLFTAAQVYYSVYIHIAIFAVCYLVCAKEQKHTTAFVSTGVVLCVIFCMMSLTKGYGLAMEHFGLFLHYITWPTLFVFVVKRGTLEEQKKVLYLLIVLCIIGDVLSLIQLAQNPDISRLLAGDLHISASERLYYQRVGVGGYGYTFAMAFLTFGVIRWLKFTDDKREKVLLITFLIVNSLYIVNASYTTAIVLAIVMAGAAIISGMQSWSRILIIVVVIVLILAFASPILQFCYELADSMELEWVAKRFGQLITAQENDDMSSLRRYELYKESWDTFASKPIFGGVIEDGDTYGGHSQLLDTLAQYGLFALLLPAFLIFCKFTCCRYIKKIKLTLFYLAFTVFLFIDTITAMQLPAILFFAVPLIAYMESEGQLHENRDPNLSLGS